MVFAQDDDGQRPSRRRRLLIVDDDPDTLLLLTRLFSRHFTVETAICYDSALSAAAEHAPDVVITDIGLPGRDGIALMRELRERYGVCGIAVTGHVIDDSELRAAGFAKYLRKPVGFDELLEAVHDACAASTV